MSEKPVKRWQLMFDEFGDGEMVKHDKGLYVLLGDYVALERRHQDLLAAIERTGGLDNIRRVEVSQPVVIDMARENAFLKGENARLKAEVERLRKFNDEALAHIAKEERKSRECLDMAQADVERLIKAGDKLVEAIQEMDVIIDMDSEHPEVNAWNAAKEGKQP